MSFALKSIAGLAIAASTSVAQFDTNLVTNPDFEAGSSFTQLPFNWEFEPSATTGRRTNAFNNTPGGGFSVSLPLREGFQQWFTSEDDRPAIVPVPPTADGGPLTLSFFYNMPSDVVSTVVGAKVVFYSDTGVFLSETPDLEVEDRNTGGEWRQATFSDIELPLATGEVAVRLFTFDDENDENTASGTVYFDDVSLTQALGSLACNDADLVAPFGVLDGEDSRAFIELAVSDQGEVSADVNRIDNPSFELGEDREGDDPDEGFVPVGWDGFFTEQDADFYEVGGVNGAPPARTGDRLVRAADSGDDGGFHGWTTLGSGAASFNLQNPVRFTGFFNIPNQINSLVVGVKLESIGVDADENFASFFGPVTLEGGPNSGDVIISNGSATDGWEEFAITYPADRLNPSANRIRPLLFLFNPDGNLIEGEIYFDDIFVGQEGVRQADFNGDGATNIFDVLENQLLVDAGCP